MNDADGPSQWRITWNPDHGKIVVLQMSWTEDFEGESRLEDVEIVDVLDVLDADPAAIVEALEAWLAAGATLDPSLPHLEHVNADGSRTYNLWVSLDTAEANPVTSVIEEHEPAPPEIGFISVGGRDIAHLADRWWTC